MKQDKNLLTISDNTFIPDSDHVFTPDIGDESNNFLRSSRGVLSLGNTNKFDLYCTSFSVPGVSATAGTMETPFIKLNFRSDKLEYQEFTCEFMIREDLANWLTIYNWLTGMTAPHNFDESTNRKLTYLDGNLIIFNSNNTPRLRITMTNMFPVRLGDIVFSSTDSETTTKTTNVEFAYDSFTITDLQAQP